MMDVIKQNVEVFRPVLQRLGLSQNTFALSLKPKFSKGGNKKTLEVTTYKAVLDVVIRVCVFDCIYIETVL